MGARACGPIARAHDESCACGRDPKRIPRIGGKRVALLRRSPVFSSRQGKFEIARHGVRETQLRARQQRERACARWARACWPTQRAELKARTAAREQPATASEGLEGSGLGQDPIRDALRAPVAAAHSAAAAALDHHTAQLRLPHTHAMPPTARWAPALLKRMRELRLAREPWQRSEQGLQLKRVPFSAQRPRIGEREGLRLLAHVRDEPQQVLRTRAGAHVRSSVLADASSASTAESMQRLQAR